MRRIGIAAAALGVVLVALVLVPRAPHADAAPPPLETIELVTGGASAADALPIVVAVHGLGDTPRNFARVFEGFPEQARFVLPRAPDRNLPGYSWFPLPRSGVGEAAFVQGIERALSRLEALLERLPAERRGIGLPVLTGFSQGGILSFAVALERPELLERVVPVAGGLPSRLVPSTRPEVVVPIRALHGAGDELLPPGPTERLVAALTGRGFDAALRVFPGVAHQITPAVRDALYAELAAGIDAARAASAARR